jgi:hypothetical protein
MFPPLGFLLSFQRPPPPADGRLSPGLVKVVLAGVDEEPLEVFPLAGLTGHGALLLWIVV